MILGLLGTEDFASERFKSIRRSVFYQYPNGSAPLLGLLSMLEGEVLNDPEFKCYEDRLIELKQLTEVNGTTSGFWYADSSGSLGSNLAATAADKVKDTYYWIRLDGYDHIRGNDILEILDATITGGTTKIQLRVAGSDFSTLSSSNHYIRATPIRTVSNVTNAHTDNAGLTVRVLGNANRQGQTGASEGTYFLPTTTENAAQIFRTPFSFTGTALATSAKFDEEGPYKDKAKKFSMTHMIQMEKQFIFGDYSKSVSNNLPTFTTGGILFFLRLWEVGEGNTYSGITNNFHGSTAVTANSSDNKRIIDGTNMTVDLLDEYYERLFRKSNEVTNEKLCLCGNGFLQKVNKLYRSEITLEADAAGPDTYGMAVVRHVTPFGTILYKTHPLMNESAVTLNDALFTDVQHLKYRYVEGRDTDIVPNTQPNNADYREDEYRTECGLDLIFPESHMYMEGVTTA